MTHDPEALRLQDKASPSVEFEVVSLFQNNKVDSSLAECVRSCQARRATTYDDHLEFSGHLDNYQVGLKLLHQIVKFRKKN